MVEGALDKRIAFSCDLSLAERLKKIDREHAMLIALQDQVLTALDRNYRENTIRKMVHVLKLYVRFHFELEESTMDMCRYPHAGDHCREHRKFLSEMERIEADFATGADVYAEIRGLFVRLADHHIHRADERFLEHARAVLEADRMSGSVSKEQAFGHVGAGKNFDQARGGDFRQGGIPGSRVHLGANR